ncbi:hypothetical protein AVEN_149572-1 [Araneus ventricosus]|uniref:Uncharacterized protein n=1 Tax=Araneus ventricosus TaxID=182803 RepID=A0A4Y2QW74_ARAVE|nr:hypothetical protein AVEN_149572-1 [Araneus ventricosus]
MEFPVIKHPSSMIISGPSNSGKTFFVKRLLDSKLIQPFPPKILWCYGAYQKLFDNMPNVEFHEGLPSDIDTVSDALIIIDDLMSEVSSDKRLSNLFTKGSHHRNLSIIFIVQNMFHKGKEMRNISLNASYLVCFKNVRDKQQISCLARQMYPSQSKFFLESFIDATQKPFGYLFLDLKPEREECLRVRTGIFPEDKNIVYVPK